MGRHRIEKPTVLLLAETGFIIRNLLLGEFAPRIARHARLIVAVLDPKDPMLTTIAHQHGFELIDFPREQPFIYSRTWDRIRSWEGRIYGIKLAERDNQSMKIQTRLFLNSTSTHKKIELYSLIIQGKIITALRLGKRMERQFLHYVLNKEIAQQWKKRLQHIRPDLVFSTMLSHSTMFRHNSDLPVVVAAHSLGIPVVTLIQSWDNISSKASILPSWLKKVYVWSESMQQELQHLHPQIRPQNIEIVGSPQFDYHNNTSYCQQREDFMHKMGLDPSRPYILMGTGTAKWMPNEPQKVVHLLERLRTEMPEMQMLVRLHPKDTINRWEPFINELTKNGCILRVTSPPKHMDQGGFVPPRNFYEEQVNAILHSVAVINSSSSLTVDAALLDKPVICIAYDLEQDPLFPEGRAYAYTQSVHYARLVRTKGVWVVRSEDECLHAIRTYYQHPELHRNERKKLVDKVTKDVGKPSGEYLADRVLDLLNELSIENSHNKPPFPSHEVEHKIKME